MSKSGCGTSLFGLLHGHVEAQGDIMIESFSDANWGGNRDSRSTSSAQHFVNGQLVHSSSRNQHCIALSSTESEYYSLVSCAIDTLYLKHILEFMFPSKNVVATVYVDNSACRQIANKLGTGRLRHIQGKLLWIQRMTKSLGKSGSKLLGPLRTQQTLAPKLFQLTDTECFATCWTCFWMVTGWENSNISEQPKPTGTNRPLKKFAMFHFPILLWPRTCSTTLWRELFNLFAWATSVWRKESCVQHATFLSHSRLWANFHFMSMICVCTARCSWFWWFLQVWSCMLSCGRLSAAMDILDVTKIRPYSFCTHLLPTREDTATRICFTIVVVMNPELSKPYDPMHTSLVRN